MLPPNIGRLTSLQTLTHFTVGHENGCQIEELGSLKNLKGKLMLFHLENVQGKEDAEKAKIYQNPNLFELRFEWNYIREGGETNDENVLEGLQPYPNLKKLEIDGFQGKRFPLWTMKMAVRDEPQGSWLGLNKLVEITLSNCTECEEIPTMGHLPNLKNLCLSRLSNVKSINSSFYGVHRIGVCQETVLVFPVLERLEILDMPNLRESAEVEFHGTQRHEVQVFPCLEYLSIEYCQQLRSAPTHFLTCLKQLKIRSLDSYMPLANICGVTLTSLTELVIYDVSRLECLPDCLFHNNQNLSKLTIEECHKLRELPDGLHTLISLEELSILGCPNLTSIGNASCSGEQLQGGLRRLSIGNCEALMDLPHEMIESWTLSLEKVSLYCLSSLTNLPKVIECLAKAARLTKLEIVGIPKFMVTRSVESWHLRSLRELEIDVLEHRTRESSVAIKGTVDGILQGCTHTLVELQLKGLEIWESLPESIQNLTALSWLKLSNFGIQKLPEWFENLSCLERLKLSKCRKLRHEGGIDALRHLTKLQALYIKDCPELCIDSEWCHRNTPHLFHAVVDGQVIY